MNLTTQQQQILSDYLKKGLKYRETYTELYDHIVSALAAKPETMLFSDAIQSIIDEDFGGWHGMSIIEAKYKTTVKRDLQKSYFTLVLEYLRFPLIGITAALTMVFYWLAIQPWFGFMFFLGLIFAMRLIPAVLRGITYIRFGYIYRSSLISVKDGVFKWLDYIPGVVLGVVMITHVFGKQSPIEWFYSLSPVMVTVFLIVFGLHTLCYCSLYKKEFKSTIVA